MYKLIVSALIACGALAPTGCAVTSGQSSMGQYVDDSTITARVKKRFAEDKQVAATRINVETVNGTVQLSGFATSETERARAAQIARSVPDVRDVRNDVIVRAATQ
jgi:osmotically-inducible protein OsmY